MTIGERIKHRRKELGLSAEDVAKKLNVDRSTVYRYESSFIEKMPTNVLEPLAKVLHTTPAYLMGWIDNSEPQKKNDAITDIILRLRSDEAFLDIVKTISSLEQDQLSAVRSLLTAFKK